MKISGGENKMYVFQSFLDNSIFIINNYVSNKKMVGLYSKNGNVYSIRWHLPRNLLEEVQTIIKIFKFRITFAQCGAHVTQTPLRESHPDLELSSWWESRVGVSGGTSRKSLITSVLHCTEFVFNNFLICDENKKLSCLVIKADFCSFLSWQTVCCHWKKVESAACDDPAFCLCVPAG